MKNKVFFNNSCNICRAEINHYKKHSNKNIEWVESKPPILKNALVNIICKVDKIVEYKTHSIVIGLVQKIRNSEYKNPLMYQDGMYRKDSV